MFDDTSLHAVVHSFILLFSWYPRAHFTEHFAPTAFPPGQDVVSKREGFLKYFISQRSSVIYIYSASAYLEIIMPSGQTTMLVCSWGFMGGALIGYNDTIRSSNSGVALRTLEEVGYTPNHCHWSTALGRVVLTKVLTNWARTAHPITYHSAILKFHCLRGVIKNQTSTKQSYITFNPPWLL